MIGSRPQELLLAGGVLSLLLLVAIAIGLWRGARTRAREADAEVGRAADLEARVAELVRMQSESTGRMRTLAEVLGGGHADLARAVSERLDQVSQRLGDGVANAARATQESLGQLNERLAVVDAAQARLTELSSHMVTLKDVLANKQARGAFGQGRMEAIVADALPKDAYTFQHTLKNNRRPDCVVYLPGDHRPLVIDAKFPLESITAFREAKGEDARKAAGQRLRQDMAKHVSDIAERYLCPGETQDMALMFMPSESVYAELFEHFDDLMQKAFRARVMIVSPSLLMLAIQVLQAIVKDARMREQAEVVRAEVAKLMVEVGRLRERAVKLQNHFAQTSDDVGQVLISAEKVAKQGARIEALEFDEIADARAKREAAPPTLPFKLGAAE